MSTVDQIIAGATSAEQVLSAAAPVLAVLLPAAGPVGTAVTLSAEALAAVKAIVAWVEKQNNLAEAVAVDAVEAAVDAAERAKFGS